MPMAIENAMMDPHLSLHPTQAQKTLPCKEVGQSVADYHLRTCKYAQLQPVNYEMNVPDMWGHQRWGMHEGGARQVAIGNAQ